MLKWIARWLKKDVDRSLFTIGGIVVVAAVLSVSKCSSLGVFLAALAAGLIALVFKLGKFIAGPQQ